MGTVLTGPSSFTVFPSPSGPCYPLSPLVWTSRLFPLFAYYEQCHNKWPVHTPFFISAHLSLGKTLRYDLLSQKEDVLIVLLDPTNTCPPHPRLVPCCILTSRAGKDGRTLTIGMAMLPPSGSWWTWCWGHGTLVRLKYAFLSTVSEGNVFSNAWGNKLLFPQNE